MKPKTGEIEAVKKLRADLAFSESQSRTREAAVVIITQDVARQLLMEIETLDSLNKKYFQRLLKKRRGRRVKDWRKKVLQDQALMGALRKEIRDVINWWWDGESDFPTCLEGATDGVMKILQKPIRKK